MFKKKKIKIGERDTREIQYVGKISIPMQAIWI